MRLYRPSMVPPPNHRLEAKLVSLSSLVEVHSASMTIQLGLKDRLDLYDHTQPAHGFLQSA